MDIAPEMDPSDAAPLTQACFTVAVRLGELAPAPDLPAQRLTGH